MFAVALNLKHINLYVAPVFFVYLLRTHCFGVTPVRPKTHEPHFGNMEALPTMPIQHHGWSWKRFWMLGCSVIVVFGASFGPFIQQMPQVFSRLFPFQRGLCHAYWAPNVWALYNILDKILTKLLKVSTGSANMTSGLVGEQAMHLVLPPVTPKVTALCTIALWMPGLVILWRFAVPVECGMMPSST